MVRMTKLPEGKKGRGGGQSTGCLLILFICLTLFLLLGVVSPVKASHPRIYSHTHHVGSTHHAHYYYRKPRISHYHYFYVPQRRYYYYRRPIYYYR